MMIRYRLNDHFLTFHYLVHTQYLRYLEIRLNEEQDEKEEAEMNEEVR